MFRLYDTRTRQVETIEPARRGLLRMYSCGPTVYRYAHVGNLRTFLLADLIRRNAEHRHRLPVLTCQNITDVGHLADGRDTEESGEDKVLAQARAEGRTALELARFYEDAFRADCSALNLRPAEHSPRASEWITLMIDMIARLIEARHAYPAPDGSVYFDARSFPSYGELSGNRLADLRPRDRDGGAADGGRKGGTGASGAADGAGKRFHADWALWKGAPAGRELTWAAPWGTGFPGWHTECSALSLHFLGDVIDVHTGGIDLRFPHHEDERAQSNSVTGRDVVRHWVHGEHLLFEGRKMAKSTQNVVLVADLADRGLDPLALRLAFLEHRYRQQMNLTWDILSAADRTLRRWRGLVAEWACSPSKPVHSPTAAQIAAAFDDDLDTPAALRALRLLEKDQGVPPGAKFESFAHADQLLGLDMARDVGRTPAQPRLPQGAQPRLAARQAARAARDWATADRLRDELAAIGVAVTDTPDGQAWTVRPAG
ncbi:MAG TPA: cysteine--tRNA ligase [Streptosporangiaceae bacterium]|nr:cysteine--tRNA ligase [Streptosporangiaceae bacterium]